MMVLVEASVCDTIYLLCRRTVTCITRTDLYIFRYGLHNPFHFQRKRIFRRRQDTKGYQILTLAGRLSVYPDVCNVYGKDLISLRQPVISVRELCITKLISNWNFQIRHISTTRMVTFLYLDNYCNNNYDDHSSVWLHQDNEDVYHIM